MTEDFFKFLVTEDMTPEQKRIFDLIQSERRLKAHYWDISQKLLTENENLSRENENLSQGRTEGGGYRQWAACCAGAVATPAVLHQLADFVGFTPVAVEQKFAFIKQLRRLTGLGLLESKLATEYLIDCAFNANSLPNQDTQHDEFTLALSNIRRGLFARYLRYRGLDAD